MRKVWLVFKREYLTRVRTRAFVFSTVLVPALLVGYVVLIIAVTKRSADTTLKIALVDESGVLAPAISANLKEKLQNGEPAVQVVDSLEKPAESVTADLRARVLSGKLGGYLVVPQGVLAGKSAEFYTKNPGDLTRLQPLRRAVGEAVVSRRLSERGIQIDDLAKVTEWVDIRVAKVTKKGTSEESGQTLILGFVVALLLYGTLIIYGVSTMRSVLEEKTSHIVEILVSSLRPVQLLAGKILGVAAVGFTQFAIWAVSGALLSTHGISMASAMSPGSASSHIHIPVPLLAYMVIFFLAGYFLYSALYSTIGAIASTDQDAQQLQIPVIVPLVLSLILLSVVLRNSNSTTSVVLSMIPFFAPILMIFRITLETPPFWQIALSLGLLIATTFGIVWFTARIYRVGILMYGKRPSLVEILRWLRYS
jgi:ABC-2 type transport system permease protein